MTDLVVTVPRDLWEGWIDEGDAAGEPETGEEWGFTCGYEKPPIVPGERLYVVSHDRLRGFALVTRVCFLHYGGGPRGECVELTYRPRGADGSWAIGRKGGAVACTIPEQIQGFRGWRPVWWRREMEVAFPEWRTADLWLNRARDEQRKAQAKADKANRPPPAPVDSGQLDMFAGHVSKGRR
jgi:hypothetical protein